MAHINRKRGSRLTPEEQLTFSRWSFVSVGAHSLDSPNSKAAKASSACQHARKLDLIGPTARLERGPRSASLPALTLANRQKSQIRKQSELHGTAPSKHLLSHAATVASEIVAPSAMTEISSCSADYSLGYDVEAVQETLEKILPSVHISTSEQNFTCSVGQRDGGHTPSFTTLRSLGQTQIDEIQQGARRNMSMETHLCNSDCISPNTNAKRQELLEHFRGQILQRFKSLHSAFSQLTNDLSRDTRLTRKDFFVALERLGVADVDADELFCMLDLSSRGYVSLCSWLHALVALSPEASLWELRCQLLRVGIGPEKMHKVLELLQWPQHGWQSKATSLKRFTARRMCNCYACARAAALQGLDLKKQANPDSEAGQAKAMLDADFEVLSAEIERKRVRPSTFHLSRGEWLKFATSIYLTLLESEHLFELLADDMDLVDLRAMFETLRLTVTPDMSLEHFASKLIKQHGSFEQAFTAFSRIITSGSDPVMDWNHFHSLAVSLVVNDQNATEIWEVLAESSTRLGDESAQEPSPSLNENDKSTVYVSQLSFVRALSLWAPRTAFDKLAKSRRERRNSDGATAKEDWATSTVKSETSQFWKTLESVKSELQLRDDVKSPAMSPAPSHSASKLALPGYVDSKRFSKAVQVAARSAENRRSKLTLHTAQRQVLNLEQRWATNSENGTPALSGRSLAA